MPAQMCQLEIKKMTVAEGLQLQGPDAWAQLKLKVTGRVLCTRISCRLPMLMKDVQCTSKHMLAFSCLLSSGSCQNLRERHTLHCRLPRICPVIPYAPCDSLLFDAPCRQLLCSCRLSCSSLCQLCRIWCAWHRSFPAETLGADARVGGRLPIRGQERVWLRERVWLIGCSTEICQKP